MPYRVEAASRRAEREIASLASDVYPRVRDAIRGLGENPRPRGCKKLGDSAYRIRVGRHRVLYQIDDNARLVTISSVGVRNERTYR